MTQIDKEGPVPLSVLDRLIDQEPERKVEPSQTRAQSVRDLKAFLRRDLEWLLNTRRTIEEIPNSCKELERSVYNYGVKDSSSLYLQSSKDQELLLKSIRTALNIFEPRLQGVKVTIEPVAGEARGMHFTIEGFLRMDPTPEPILFDTVLESSNGKYNVVSA